MSTLSVSSGMRLISSTYSSEPSRIADDQRAVDEHVGVVAVGQHPGRVEVADQSRRGELGVALDELEPEPELVGDRRAAAWSCPCRAALPAGRGGRRPARPRPARSRVAPDDGRPERLDELARCDPSTVVVVDPRVSVMAITSGRNYRRRRRTDPRRTSAMDDDAADVLAVAHRLVALVDLLERVACW